MNKALKYGLLALTMSFFGLVSQVQIASAYYPSLSISNSGGDNVSIYISGAQPNSTVSLSYTPTGSSLATTISNFGYTDYSGNYSGSASASAYGFSSGSQIYVTVAGQQSNTLNFNGYTNYYTGCTYNCGNPYYGSTLSLSQTSLNMTVGQTSNVTVNSYPVYSGVNAVYISSNSNSSVATASVVGSQINIYAQSSGSATIYVCQTNNSSNCAYIYVNVSGSIGSCGYYGAYNCNSTLTLSQTSLNITAGQSNTISISNSGYYSNSYYIYSNTNSAIASASISASNLYISGLTNGSTTIKVCLTSNSSICGYVYVTVSGSVLGASNYPVNIYDGYFSPQTITVPVGSTITWRNSGYSAHGVIINNGYGSSGILYQGNSYTLSFPTAGTYYYYDTYNSSITGTIIVTNSGSGTSGSVWFNPSNPTLYTGQSLAVAISSASYASSAYGYQTSNNFYVSSNSNPNAVSASVNGSVLNLYGTQSGSSTLTVCQYSLSYCGTIYVTVNGGGSYYGSNLSLSQSTLPLTQGQSSSVSIYGSGSYYVSNNTSPYVASTNISGSSLYVSGTSAGTTTITVCQSGYSSCVTLFVTVSGQTYYGYTGGGLQYPGGNGGSVLGATTFANGTLISENGTVYITYKNLKTAFANQDAFLGLGYNFNNLTYTTNSGLSSSGYTVNSRYVQHPWGSWIKSGNTIYFVHELGLIAVPSWDIFISNGGQSNMVVPANSYDFRLAMQSSMTYNDSRLK